MPCIVIVLLLSILLPSCASEDKLVVGKPLSPGDVIVSSDGAFALGFFSPSNSTPAKLYLGIWYNGIPKLTVVWIANRETPIIVTGRSASSAPTLALTNTSNLVLSDADDGRLVWSTNVIAGTAGFSAPLGAAEPAATLTNSGNLELRSANGTMLWQSFDHPSDTFLPDMRIRVSRGGRAGDRLVSWKSPGDPSPGGFTYGIDPVTSLQLFTWNGSSPLWRSGVWTGYRVASDFIEETGAVVLLTVLDLKDDASMSFDIRPPVTRTRYVMSYSGELVLQSWNNASLEWDELGVWPPHGCSRYGYCGAFGYCDNTVAAPTCKCLDGFAPASPEEWSSGRFSSGCRRKEELRCGDGDGFLPLPAMKAPDRFVVVGNRSLDECAAECRRNCSCVAFAYANLSSSAKGDPTRCLVWVGELIDAEKIGGNVAGSETLHLRLAGLAKGLLCVQDNPNDRPLMSSVLFVLENGSTTLPIPKKPVYFAHRNNEVEQGRGNSQSSKNSVTLSALDGR
uniref:non-specific serine/threonine protein kinase n=1 Tax=Setaria italica TaxID=4555 RepID=K4A2F5_SETIT